MWLSSQTDRYLSNCAGRDLVRNMESRVDFTWEYLVSLKTGTFVSDFLREQYLFYQGWISKYRADTLITEDSLPICPS